jgi:hypothetical protein
MNLQEKINLLLSLSNEFLFIEYYTHTKEYMWKIKNIFTEYSQEKVVLYATNETFEKSLDAAIEYISKAKEKFLNN